MNFASGSTPARRVDGNGKMGKRCLFVEQTTTTISLQMSQFFLQCLLFLQFTVAFRPSSDTRVKRRCEVIKGTAATRRPDNGRSVELAATHFAYRTDSGRPVLLSPHRRLIYAPSA